MLLLIVIMRIKMSNVYIEKDSYNRIIRLGREPSKFVNEAVKEKLKEIES